MTLTVPSHKAGSDWQSRLRKARHVVRHEGLPRLITRFLHWSVAAHLDMGRLQFFTRDLRAPLPPETPTPADLTLRLARADEIDKVLRGGNPAHDRELIEARFASADRCFVAVDDRGEIAHCRWVTTHRAYVPELESDVVLAPGHAYMYDGFTRPDMRRRGIDGLVRCFIFRTMRRTGHVGVHSCVRGDNPGGMRAARRWQQPTGHVWHLRLRRLSRALRRSSDMPAALELSPRERDSGDGAAAWRRWFESWTDKPLENRSTGFSALPEEYFRETAAHVRDTLELSPVEDRVLDVGCDSAVLSRHVATACRSLVGVDFVRALLADPAARPRTGDGGVMRLINADGRRLPFPDDSYSKVYCAGMIHTLPSHADGMEVIGELVRVCEPGGAVLVAAVPDAARRGRHYREVWRRGGWRQRLLLVAGLATPRWLRRLGRRWIPVREGEELAALEYDLAELRDLLRDSGLDCRLVDFPPTYWSRDFRLTRSNLLIHVPERSAS